jgi:alkylated DNA repair dioxygenase AlkB
MLVSKCRVVSFGWEYDFSKRRVYRVEDLPTVLLPLRDRTASFEGLPPSKLSHALVTEYQAGAPIGWHKDKAVFGDVIGVSLFSPCVFPSQTQERSQLETCVHHCGAAFSLPPARSGARSGSTAFRRLRACATPSLSGPPDHSEA